MQKDQEFKLEVSSEVEVDSQCSCPECDSASCFVKRRAKGHCTWLAASELHTLSSQSLKLVTETKHSISKPSILPEEQIVPDFKRKRIFESSISEVTRQIISDFMKESNKSIFPESTTTIFKISNTSFSQRQCTSKITSGCNKDSCKESKNDKGSNVYCYRKKAYLEGSENVNLPKDDACQNMSTAVGHSMLHQELQAPIPKAKISSAMVNLSAMDIYNKIKEAYKACSCDVCKCIVGKSLQSKFCECKPCECHDCANLSECMLNYIGTEVIQKHDEQRFCLLSDKKSCQVLEDSETRLQGYHGRQERLKLRNRSKDCDCKCFKCKARSIHRTLIVARGEELQSHNGCQCAPCECLGCRHRYDVNTNGHHDISTSVNRHPNCHCDLCDNEACIPDNNQSCRCVRQSKVMSKPVERDSQDYDIHTAHVTYNNKGICEGNFETLAMFAALPNSYTKRQTVDQSKKCNCDPCECLNCEYLDRINSQDVFQSYQIDQELNGKIKYCKPEVLKQFKLEGRRVFNKCNCIDCPNLASLGVKDEKATKYLNKKCSSRHVCDCNICAMGESTETDYYKKHGEDVSVDIFRLMKTRRQTRLRDNDPLIQSCIDTLELNKKIFQEHELAFHASKSSTSIDNFGESQHPTCSQVCYGSHRIFCPNFETDSVVHEHISERANEIDLKTHNKQTLNSSLTIFSSKSFVKESESVTPVTSKLKSRESSCNSSGYDYPDYLAHFPKLTIKTCLDDVMQSDLSNNEVFNMGSNYNIVPKSSHFNLHDRKSFQPQTLSARSSKNIKVNRKASQTLDIPNYINQIRNLTKETRKTYKLSKYKVNTENKFDKFKTDSASTSTTNTSAKGTFNEEYIRVQKTLRDARKYSQHLVSLFEKYEKANKEFESVTERIKNSNNSIDRHINTFVVQEVPTKDSECTFTSAFDEIDTINKQEKYIDRRDIINYPEKPVDIRRDSINYPEKPVDILKNYISTDHDGSNDDYAFIDINHIITEEKNTKKLNKQKMSIGKKLEKRQIQVTERTQDVVTPQRCILQSSKMMMKNDIVLISDNQSLGNHRDFQESFDTKVIDTVENTDEDCHDKSNIYQANISKKLGKENNIKTIEEIKSISVKKDFHHITSTKFTKNTDLSTKCTTELINLSKSKSTRKTKTESRKLLLEVLHSPIKDMNSDNLKQEGIKISLPHESDGKAATEVISQQPVDEHSTYVNKSKSLKRNTIVNKTTESSKLLLENLDRDNNSSKVKEEESVSLPPPHKTDEKAATESISNQTLDEHYVNKSKAVEIIQTEVKRILDLPFLQVVKEQKKCAHDINCEAMKVTTLVAHRISDHSVAMKWKAPSLATNVTGYEVLIDGRFVQKITNPSRRTAVLCCLPHAEKVLLTVRTVVAVPVSDHYPAVTLVYHTRIKPETLTESRNPCL